MQAEHSSQVMVRESPGLKMTPNCSKGGKGERAERHREHTVGANSVKLSSSVSSSNSSPTRQHYYTGLIMLIINE